MKAAFRLLIPTLTRAIIRVVGSENQDDVTANTSGRAWVRLMAFDYYAMLMAADFIPGKVLGSMIEMPC